MKKEGDVQQREEQLKRSRYRWKNIIVKQGSEVWNVIITQDVYQLYIFVKMVMNVLVLWAVYS
jgi:hypothetical protein